MATATKVIKEKTKRRNTSASSLRAPGAGGAAPQIDEALKKSWVLAVPGATEGERR
ncbi:hypothetical protein [Sphingomonas sp. R86520]|uniref:hypothetical protein n=1 Tax=Sphingomonas sp. R86520 TaxID=3093859 RepID=UPI0036D33072